MVIELCIVNESSLTYNEDCRTVSVISCVVSKCTVKDFGIVTVYKYSTGISSCIELYGSMLVIVVTIVIWVVIIVRGCSTSTIALYSAWLPIPDCTICFRRSTICLIHSSSDVICKVTVFNCYIIRHCVSTRKCFVVWI